MKTENTSLLDPVPFAQTPECRRIDENLAALQVERREYDELPTTRKELETLREQIAAAEIASIIHADPQLPGLRLRAAELERKIQSLVDGRASWTHRRDSWSTFRRQTYEEWVTQAIDGPTRFELRKILPELIAALEQARKINERVAEIAGLRSKYNLGLLGPYPGLTAGHGPVNSDYERYLQVLFERRFITEIPSIEKTELANAAAKLSEIARQDERENANLNFRLGVFEPLRATFQHFVGRVESTARERLGFGRQ